MKDVAYQKQIVLYINNKSCSQAYEMSMEYLKEYPDDMVAHFLCAKSALLISKDAEAALEARKAFNLAKNEADMLMCVIHACVAYFKLGEYAKGFELLKATESIRTCEESEQLFFLFSLATNNDAEAGRHFNAMISIDSDAAHGFLKALAEGAQVDFERIFRKTDRITY